MNGPELRRIRRVMRLTQQELAAELGIGRSSVQHYEYGDRPVPRVVELAVRHLHTKRRMSNESLE